MTFDQKTPLGCVPGGIFAFWEGAILPGFPVTTLLGHSAFTFGTALSAPKRPTTKRLRGKLEAGRQIARRSNTRGTVPVLLQRHGGGDGWGSFIMLVGRPKGRSMPGMPGMFEDMACRCPRSLRARPR
jgi:hypothetical protein